MANPTSNMGLTLPDVSVTPGPTWASQINSDLTLIDQHNHIPNANGGVPITSAALQIDADVEFNTILPGGAAAKGLSFLGLLAPVGTANVPTRIYSNDVGDLYYDNSAGVPVRLTNGASVAGVQGSITNLATPASANYNSSTGTFEWQSAANTGANMDSGPVTVRDGSAGANGITITPPSGLAAAYTLTLPSSAPSGQRLMTANAGVSSFASVDSTLTLTSSLLKVANNGITQSQLASNAVTTSKITNGAVTQQKLGPKSVAASASVDGASTNSTTPAVVSDSTTPANTLSLSTTLRAGYAAMVIVQPSGNGFSEARVNGSVTNDLLFSIQVTSIIGTSVISVSSLRSSSGALATMPVNGISYVFTPVSDGAHTFSILWSVGSASLSGSIYNAKLLVYEL